MAVVRYVNNGFSLGAIICGTDFLKLNDWNSRGMQHLNIYVIVLLLEWQHSSTVTVVFQMYIFLIRLVC